MTPATIFGLCGAIVAGLGLYGLLVDPRPLRKLLAFNLLGNGSFVIFGVIARRGAGAGFAGDPVPHGLLITAIVVSFAASALAVALILRLFEASGSASLRTDAPPAGDAATPEA